MEWAKCAVVVEQVFAMVRYEDHCRSHTQRRDCIDHLGEDLIRVEEAIVVGVRQVLRSRSRRLRKNPVLSRVATGELEVTSTRVKDDEEPERARRIRKDALQLVDERLVEAAIILPAAWASSATTGMIPPQ